MSSIISKTLPIYTVDAFTKSPFSGNPAAVVLVSYQSLSKEIKQKIAAEMNLSETAYITLKSEKDLFEKANSFVLEWFTPTCEVSLCGHATLASAAVLFKALNNKNPEINFESASGILKAKHIENKVEINIPAYNSRPDDRKHEELVKAVVGSLEVVDVVVSESDKLLIRLSDQTTRKELESIHVVFDKIVTLAADIVGVIVTMNAVGKDNCLDEDGNQFDFLSRYFAPWLGVNEDPVTGSAHSVLVPYWAKIMKKNTFHARQCSPRGGNLFIKYVDDRVHISGNATIVLQGQITL